MAAKVTGYFSKGHDGSISGTPAFMSTAARYAFEGRRAYVQSPIDDMESFYWTAVWATLNNTKSLSTSEEEGDWKRWLATSNNDRRAVTQEIDKLASLNKLRRQCSPFLAVMAPMLQKWWELLKRMNIQWQNEWADVEDGPPLPKELLFHKFAYEVVPMYVDLLEGEKARLQAFSQSGVAA
ncbi:hypothetical protein C0991_011629 [Blastosporella zonata]|nr:hypothetical protein C0991_011629 [Blastosporella zonata]